MSSSTTCRRAAPPPTIAHVAVRARSTAAVRSLRAALLPLALLSTACGGSVWRGVDADRMTIVVVGTVQAIRMSPTGEVRLELAPREADRYALAPGQERLGCIVQPSRRGVLEPVLRGLSIGQTVEVSGYWTARDEPSGRRHYINETTSIDPFVE